MTVNRALSHRVRRSNCAQRKTLAAVAVQLAVANACVPPSHGDKAHVELTTPRHTDRERRGTLGMESATETAANFILQGKPFCFLGTNNYYLSYKSKRMVDDIFASAARLNLEVIRTWGFIDRGSLDGSVRSVSSSEGTQDGVYFQYWDSERGAPAYNDGPDGLQRLDYVLHRARQSGRRVLLVLTNNWRDFGGMDQYLEWYELDEHHRFFTDPRIRKAYKDWVLHLVERVNTIDGTPYKEDPAIFAWELANEPRTTNGSSFDSQDGWDETTITAWAAEMAAFLKSIDPNHMVSVGDEGFLSRGRDHWAYEAANGVDHEALLGIPEIDFGTFHLYPDHWGTDSRWSDQWIRDHIAAARLAGKPTILEEYGRIVERDKDGHVTSGSELRLLEYRAWNQIILEEGGNAALHWMLSGIDDANGYYPDYDGFGTYIHDETSALVAEYASKMKGSAVACRMAPHVPTPPSPFVSAQHLAPILPTPRGH